MQRIKNSINLIISYDPSIIAGLSSTERNALSNQRIDVFNYQDLVILSGNINEIQNQLIDLDGFAENFSFVDLRQVIQEGISDFKTNLSWNLIFLDTWKTNLSWNIQSTKNKFDSIT
jgi:hypothetical protein